MKVFRLTTNPNNYSSNVYYILGNWNKLNDINTLVDTGADGYYLPELNRISHGLGKRKVEKIILTHMHFDHTGGLKLLKELYNPLIYTLNVHSDFHRDSVKISRVLRNGETIRMGDSFFRVISTPGHSNDSLCLYSSEERVLFSGDLPLHTRVADDSYSKEYLISIEALINLKIDIIYPGHGNPITDNPERIIRNTYDNILKCKII